MKSLALICLGLTIGFALASHRKQTQPVLASKLTNVVLTTSKMDAESKFYELTLGFKIFFHNETSCFLKSGGVNLVFVKAKRVQDETKNVCIDVSLGSLDEATVALEKAGIPFERKDLAIVTLHDPDGNLVEIVHG
jgi:catechol-2,3-dioxygenase